MTLNEWSRVEFADWDIWNIDTPEEKEENRGEMYIVPEWEGE